MEPYGTFEQVSKGYFAWVTWESRADRIDHSGPKLLWQQVADDLAADIESGVLRPGTKLLPEVELAERYQVARVTIRRAVAELEKTGQLTVVHGRGTFVTRGE